MSAGVEISAINETLYFVESIINELGKYESILLYTYQSEKLIIFSIIKALMELLSQYKRGKCVFFAS